MSSPADDWGGRLLGSLNAMEPLLGPATEVLRAAPWLGAVLIMTPGLPLLVRGDVPRAVRSGCLGIMAAAVAAVVTPWLGVPLWFATWAFSVAAARRGRRGGMERPPRTGLRR